MKQFRPSTGAWLGVAFVALTVMRWATAAPDAPEELPPPAATMAAKADESEDGARSRKPNPSDGRCDRCDGCMCVHRVCVAKRTEKEVIKVCWSYKCEDFCIPGPSISCGEKCLHDSCGCWTHSLWKPTCAEVRTKRVPVKNVVKRKVPGVEWKVEERCKACRFLCVGIDAPKKTTESDRPAPRREDDDDRTDAKP